MLSICVPVYNYDARPLVAELLRQAESLAAGVEVLVYDDGSQESFTVLTVSLQTSPGYATWRCRKTLAAPESGTTWPGMLTTKR